MKFLGHSLGDSRYIKLEKAIFLAAKRRFRKTYTTYRVEDEVELAVMTRTNVTRGFIVLATS